MYTKTFLKKLLQKFVLDIFTLLLASFAPKLVNYSRHRDSLRYVWKSTNRSYRSKMSSISEFFRMFKDSSCLEKLTNLDAKFAKRSVKIWTTDFYKSFSNICMLLYMNGLLSKFRLVLTYVMPGRFILVEYVYDGIKYKSNNFILPGNMPYFIINLLRNPILAFLLKGQNRCFPRSLLWNWPLCIAWKEGTPMPSICGYHHLDLKIPVQKLIRCTFF